MTPAEEFKIVKEYKGSLFLVDIQAKSFTFLNDGHKLVIDKATNDAIIYSPMFTVVKRFESNYSAKSRKVSLCSHCQTYQPVQVHWRQRLPTVEQGRWQHGHHRRKEPHCAALRQVLVPRRQEEGG
jgi:hypothetical protein